MIVWDEAPMKHKFAFEALDSTLQDLTKIKTPFGGKSLVCGGDFRQILPVIPDGTPEKICEAALNASHLWQHFEIFRLTKNMRVQRLLEQGQDASKPLAFCQFLLDIGEGKHTKHIDLN